jgi:hypothetical protein
MRSYVETFIVRAAMHERGAHLFQQIAVARRCRERQLTGDAAHDWISFTGGNSA